MEGTHEDRFLQFAINVQVHGYSVAGDILEPSAITAELPQQIAWDRTNEDRKDDFVMDPIRRTLRHPPHWQYLPVVVSSVVRDPHPPCPCWRVPPYS